MVATDWLALTLLLELSKGSSLPIEDRAVLRTIGEAANYMLTCGVEADSTRMLPDSQF
jgi:hypothetical protein